MCAIYMIWFPFGRLSAAVWEGAGMEMEEQLSNQWEMMESWTERVVAIPTFECSSGDKRDKMQFWI